MGNVSDQMEALAQDILTSTHERKSAVADIKAGTGRMLSAFNGERRGSATRLRAELSADCRARSRAMAKLMDEFKMSRGEMAKALTESLGMFAQRVQSQVSTLREGFRASLREIREDIQAAHQIWNVLLVAHAGVAAPTAMPARDFEAEEAEEKPTVGERVRRFVAKRGKPKKH